MTQRTPLQNTTLAIQHYYDLKSISQKLPIATLYHTIEQPSTNVLSLWTLENLEQWNTPEDILKELELKIIAAKKLQSSALAKIIDYGTIEQKIPFAVTQPFPILSIREYLNNHNPLPPHLAFLIIEQIAKLTIEAHSHNIHYLGLSTQSIALEDLNTLRIKIAPPFLALSRKQLQRIENAPTDIELYKHIPPWEFNEQTPLHNEPSSEENLIDNEQDLQNPQPLLQNQEDEKCPDLYAIACIAYELLTSKHPYFYNDNLNDALLTILREKPDKIDEKFGASTSLAQLIHQNILNPSKTPNAINDFLNQFYASLSDEQKKELIERKIPYENNEKAQEHKIKFKKHSPPLLSYNFLILIIILFTAISIVLIAFFRLQNHPHELFTIPQLIPPTTDNQQTLVIIAKDNKNKNIENADVYNVNDNGELIKLGTAPLILKNQPQNIQLNLLLTADKHKPAQSSVTLANTNPSPIILELTLDPQ